MKKHSLIATTFLFTLFVSFTSLAGQWIETDGKWYYMTDDGNFAKNTWLWLDENHDTKGELYHFDTDGVMSQNTSIALSDHVYDSFLVNIDCNGVATGYTASTSWETYYTPFETRTFPTNYSVNLDSDGKYVYSLDVDHYDFKEIKYAITEYGGISFKKTEDGYSAAVSLPIFINESDSDVFNNFDYGIETVAKFSKNCKVRNHFETDEPQPISDFLKKKKDGRYNYVEVFSIDADGYITDCAISGAM